jgi:hypothetical protein
VHKDAVKVNKCRTFLISRSINNPLSKAYS